MGEAILQVTHSRGTMNKHKPKQSVYQAHPVLGLFQFQFVNDIPTMQFFSVIL